MLNENEFFLLNSWLLNKAIKLFDALLLRSYFSVDFFIYDYLCDDDNRKKEEEKNRLILYAIVNMNEYINQ